MSPEQRADLIDTYLADLREKAEHADADSVIWVALHASAALTADLGAFESEGIRVS